MNSITDIMSAQKTLGPWSVKRPSFGRGLFIAPPNAYSVRRAVAKVLVGDEDEDEDEEERVAYLMAAAPELLAALQEIISLCAVGDVDEDTEALGWGKAIKAANAAIAKATGVQS